jgi:uncharacterized protein
MTTVSQIDIPQRKLSEFCKRNHIRKLSLFGSVLREDFGENSDVDVLVEFEEGEEPGLIGLAGMELELSTLFYGRQVDINTPLFLSPYFRDEVLASARVIYARS